MGSHAYAAIRMILQIVVLVNAAENDGKDENQRQAERKPLLL
jgi:hypothetical protein